MYDKYYPALSVYFSSVYLQTSSFYRPIVCPSDRVRPSVTLYIVAKRYILQQNCLNK